MNRAQRRELARTLLAWVVLVLLVQVATPAALFVRAAQGATDGVICRTVSDEGGDTSAPDAHHEACPVCAMRADHSAPVALPPAPPMPTEYAEATHPLPYASAARPRAPPHEPGQPRAPPFLS